MALVTQPMKSRTSGRALSSHRRGSSIRVADNNHCSHVDGREYGSCRLEPQSFPLSTLNALGMGTIMLGILAVPNLSHLAAASLAFVLMSVVLIGTVGSRMRIRQPLEYQQKITLAVPVVDAGFMSLAVLLMPAHGAGQQLAATLQAWGIPGHDPSAAMSGSVMMWFVLLTWATCAGILIVPVVRRSPPEDGFQIVCSGCMIAAMPAMGRVAGPISFVAISTANRSRTSSTDGTCRDATVANKVARRRSGIRRNVVASADRPCLARSTMDAPTAVPSPTLPSAFTISGPDARTGALRNSSSLETRPSRTLPTRASRREANPEDIRSDSSENNLSFASARDSATSLVTRLTPGRSTFSRRNHATAWSNTAGERSVRVACAPRGSP